MRFKAEQSLAYFQFWAGAKENARKLNFTQIEELDEILDEIYQGEITETEINDLFWFSFDEIIQYIGLKINDDLNIEEIKDEAGQ